MECSKCPPLALLHAESFAKESGKDLRFVSSGRSFQIPYTAAFRSARFCGFGFSLLKVNVYFVYRLVVNTPVRRSGMARILKGMLLLKFTRITILFCTEWMVEPLGATSSRQLLERDKKRLCFLPHLPYVHRSMPTLICTTDLLSMWHTFGAKDFSRKLCVPLLPYFADRFLIYVLNGTKFKNNVSTAPAHKICNFMNIEQGRSLGAK